MADAYKYDTFELCIFIELIEKIQCCQVDILITFWQQL